MSNNTLIIIILFLTSFAASADSALSGKKTITLLGTDNKSLDMGSIEFGGNANNVSYQITLDDSEFSNEFLSMRPFKCITVADKMVCHLVYPYAKQGYINQSDLVDLEYDLLFLHKAPGEYGINAWNGLYYDLTINNDVIEGTLKEVDLNILAAQPENGELRPITADMLHDADPQHHLFPKLIIQ